MENNEAVHYDEPADVLYMVSKEKRKKNCNSSSNRAQARQILVRVSECPSFDSTVARVPSFPVISLSI